MNEGQTPETWPKGDGQPNWLLENWGPPEGFEGRGLCTAVALRVRAVPVGLPPHEAGCVADHASS